MSWFDDKLISTFFLILSYDFYSGQFSEDIQSQLQNEFTKFLEAEVQLHFFLLGVGICYHVINLTNLICEQINFD